MRSRNRSLTTSIAFGAALGLGGCLGSASTDYTDEFTDPRAQGFNPTTPAACPVDPDAYIGGDASLYECPDFWICEDAPTGGKQCYTPGPDYPDGGAWECHDEGGRTICRGDHYPDGGGSSGWDCRSEGEFVVCETGGDYPDGGGWDCYYASGYRVCETPGYGDGGGGGDLPGGGGGGFGDGGGGFCFYPVGEPGAPPLVTGGYRFETIGGRSAVHVTLVFDPSFVDNSYGVNASDGYRGGGANSHTFRDLVSSDHAEVGFADATGREVVRAKFDYITASPTVASGYDCLGATGGDGAVISGDASAILDATSSLDRNFNELGCVYTVDSPTPDLCPGWEMRVIYEMWLDAAAFGSAGFGYPLLSSVHASPSRVADTIPVEPGPCP